MPCRVRRESWEDGPGFWSSNCLLSLAHCGGVSRGVSEEGPRPNDFRAVPKTAPMIKIGMT